MKQIENAIKYILKHHANQYRKGTNIPYVTHPISAAMALQSSGIIDENVIVATLLHDVLEDTSVSYEELKDAFSERIADLVASVSENKQKSWEARKLHAIEALETCSYETKLIALADKFHNMSTMREDLNIYGNQLWSRFNKPFEFQKWHYTRILEVLSHDERIKELKIFKDLEKLTSDVFGELTKPTPMKKVPSKPAEGEKNIGYGEGILSDGSPFKYEFWAVDGISNVTFYISGDDIELLPNEEIIKMFVDDGWLEYYGVRQSAGIGEFVDSRGNHVLSVNVVIGDESDLYANAKSLIYVRCRE